MSNKTVTFDANVNVEQALRDLTQIERKMKEMQKYEASAQIVSKMAAGQNTPSGVPNLTQANDQVFNRNLQNLQKQSSANIAELNKVLAAHKIVSDELDAQLRLQKGQNEELEETVRLKREVAAADQALITLQNKQAGIEKAIQNAPGGPGGGAGGGGFFNSVVASVGLGTAVSVAKMVGDEFVRRQVDITKMQGSAIAGTTGKALQQMQSGQYTYEGMFGEERKSAAEKAKSTESNTRNWELIKLIGGAALVIGGLAATATGVGAAGGIPTTIAGLGSLGIGTAIGATATGVGAATLLSGRSRFDSEKYEAEKAQQYSANFNELLDAEKEKTPYKKDAIEKLQKNAGGYLNYQRMLGLSGSAGLFGNLSNITSAGFTDQMGMEAAGGILGAGGSTRMGKRSEIALQAERGLGLTNAPQLLGMLSGTQGIPEASRRTLLDISAEGQMRGLDNSKYAQENRQFMQNVAEVVSKGGTTSVEAADTITRIMGSFTGGATTMRGLEQGKTAFEAFQNAGTQTSGYMGGFNIAGELSMKGAGRVRDPSALQAFMQMPITEMEPNDPALQEMAQQRGYESASEMISDEVKRRAKSQVNAMQRPKAWKAFSEKQQAYQAANHGSMVGFDDSDLGGTNLLGLRGQIGRITGTTDTHVQQKQLTALSEQSNMTPALLEAWIKRQKEESTAAEKKTIAPGGTDLDKIVQASAENAKVALKTLSDSINQFAENSIRAAASMGNTIAQAQIIEQKVKDTHIAMDEANKKLSDYDKAHHIMPGQLDKGHFALVNAANAANAASDKALAEQDANSRTISAGGHK